jgi:hypothetical protein
VRVEVRGLREALDGLKRLRGEGIPRLLNRVRFNVALRVKKHAIDNATGPILKRRSGGLVQFTARQNPELQGTAVVWGLPGPDLQARIGAFLEVGGTIRPKIAKMLRIPLDAAKTPAGVDRYAGVPLRTVPGFWVKKISGGRLLLMRTPDRSPNSVPQAWYLLTLSSTIPSFPWFSRAVASAESEIPGLITAAIQEAEAGRG